MDGRASRWGSGDGGSDGPLCLHVYVYNMYVCIRRAYLLTLYRVVARRLKAVSWCSEHGGRAFHSLRLIVVRR